jgi:hypothetical protein
VNQRAFSLEPGPIVVLLLACASLPVAASVPVLPNTSSEIVIDGIMDDDAWEDAVAIPIDVQTHPGENIRAQVDTVAYLIEDGESLYIAFDAKDPAPHQIRAYLRDRDSAWDDDIVGIIVDSFGDEQRAFEFFVNPLGVQMDLTQDDVAKREDDSWDAIWHSAGRVGKEGYIVEVEIPLSQLRFSRINDKQSWGVDLVRYYPRGHRYRLSSNPLDRSRNCYLCQLQKIQGLEDVEPGRDLEIVPTLTASEASSTDEAGVEPLHSAGADAEIGVSVRWGISPDLTANLAINPDFSQIEADVAQLDANNRFALFYPEKRPFFLEAADYFHTPVQAVFTRTVADPSVGAKLTGKRGDNTFGVFLAEDERTDLIFPGASGSDSESLDQENTVFVGRYSRSFADQSTVGGLLTARSGDNYHNTVGGLDLSWKLSDQHRVQARRLRPTVGHVCRVRHTSRLQLRLAQLDGFPPPQRAKRGVPGRCRICTAGRYRPAGNRRRTYLVRRRKRLVFPTAARGRLAHHARSSGQIAREAARLSLHAPRCDAVTHRFPRTFRGHAI